jgi:hypothetical protein
MKNTKELSKLYKMQELNSKMPSPENWSLIKQSKLPEILWNLPNKPEMTLLTLCKKLISIY